MNAIVKRNVFLVRTRLSAPLSLASGEDAWTDADILRDADGQPFVPGSSLAGAVRSYLAKEKDEPCLMGYAAGASAGAMSSLFISDMTFETETVTGVRDGVALDRHKIAVDGSKYDREILEAGAEGYFYMELVVRQKDDEAQMDADIARICRGIQQGEIRLGSKKTRGMGKFEITGFSVKTYEKETYLEYADAYAKETWVNAKDELVDWLAKADREDRMVHIVVPLQLKGGISIRRYAAKKNEPDFVQLTDHGVPVIPGSSFAGAIRHRTEQILRGLETQGVVWPIPIDEIISTTFGYVLGDRACASNVIIGEAEIRGAKPLTMVRTGISRFEAAVKQGALYKERTYVDGTLQLEIAVRKADLPEDTGWILGILLLAVKDLQHGFLAVGGQTAIGRGVFQANGPLMIDGEADREDGIIKEAFQCLARRKGEAR